MRGAYSRHPRFARRGGTFARDGRLALPPAARPGAARHRERRRAARGRLPALGSDDPPPREQDLATGALGDGARIDDTQVLPGGQLAVVWHTSPRLTLGFEARLP